MGKEVIEGSRELKIGVIICTVYEEGYCQYDQKEGVGYAEYIETRRVYALSFGRSEAKIPRGRPKHM
jgi:hypothetical protein